MRSAFLWLISFFLILLAGICAVGGYGVYAFLKQSTLTENKIVMIERGSGVSQISRTLKDQGVISSALVFHIAARLLADQGLLKAGEYEFTASMPMARILKMIQKGEVIERKFTIAEGLTSHQIIRILNSVAGLEGDITELPAEGTLMPDTYHFMKGDTRPQKINEMRTAMTRFLDDIWEHRAPDLPITTKAQALILASIIEKETSQPDEWHRVAGVFVNRLRLGMPLQTDPTVIYAITQGDIQDAGQGPLGRRLLSKDLAFDSPYNTYKYPGLPPGPICHPGKNAIKAALNPEKHDYIFFVADGTGGGIYLLKHWMSTTGMLRHGEKSGQDNKDNMT